MSPFQTAHGGALHLTKRLVANRVRHCTNVQAHQVRHLCASQHWTDEYPATLLQAARVAFPNACAEPRPISQSAHSSSSTPLSLARATTARWATLAWSAVGLATAAPWRLLLASARPPPPLDHLDDGARARRAARARRRAEEALDRADGVRSKRRPMLKKKREDPEGGGPWPWPDRQAPGPKKRKQQHPPRERGGGGGGAGGGDSRGPREPPRSGRNEASRGGGWGKDGAPWEGSGPRREKLTPAQGKAVDKKARVGVERREAVGKNNGEDVALRYSRQDWKQMQERKPRDITEQKIARGKSSERPESGVEAGP